MHLVPLILAFPFAIKFGRFYLLFSFSFMLLLIFTYLVKINSILLIFLFLLILPINNIYNHYRGYSSDKNFTSVILNNQITLSNLKSRSPPWQFLYQLIDNKNEFHLNLNQGRLLKQSLINAIPRILIPPTLNKIEVERIMVKDYWLESTDYPDTIITELFCDFGVLAGILAAFIISLLFRLNLLIIRILMAMKQNEIVSIIFIRFLYGIYNFEYSLSSILVIQRDTLLFSFSILIFYAIKKFKI